MDFTCITCSICLDVIVQASTLGCGHSFCEFCLDEAVNCDDRCPECRQYTQGICIKNLRLDDCIQEMVKHNRDALDRYTKRRSQCEEAIAIRRRARVILFSVLYHSRNALTVKEIEKEWARSHYDEVFNEELKKEISRIVTSNQTYFKIEDCQGESRVMMKKSGEEGRL